MRAPADMDEYIDLVHQAIYEIDELNACIEDDTEEMEHYLAFIAPLDNQLRELYSDMTGGKYQLSPDTDLPFMAIVRKFGAQIPFKQLLEVINTTHRRGFE